MLCQIVAYGMATVAYVVPLGILVIVVLILWMAGVTATVADAKPPYYEPCGQILCQGTRWNSH